MQLQTELLYENIVSLTDMNRYDSTAQTPDESIPPDQFNLSIVRPGLSRFSRTVRADFKVRSTPQAIEVQFSRHRIRESLVANVPESDRPRSTALALLVILTTVVFVGGAVAFTGSILLGIIVAALLPIPYALIASPKGNRSRCRQAILKLVHTPDGQLLLTLMTAAKSSRARTATSLSETMLHVSQIPVYSVQSGPIVAFSADSPLCYQVSFTFSGSPSGRLAQLRITGSRQEIRWLCNHLEWWGRASKPASLHTEVSK